MADLLNVSRRRRYLTKLGNFNPLSTAGATDGRRDDRRVEKERKCLRCGKAFLSRDAGNRICKKCSSANADEHVPKSVSNSLSPFEKDFSGTEDEDL